MSWNLIYFVDMLAILLFAISYYRQCYRKGYRVDFWHTQLLFNVIFPYLFMLAFVRNELNAVIVGHDFGAIVDASPTIFAIVIVGYLSVLLGGMFWKLRVGFGMRTATLRMLEFGPRCSMMLMSSPGLLVFLAVFCACLQSLMLAVYFTHDGFGFNFRAYTFANPGIRPFAQITALCSIVVASHCLARYVDTKERVLLACTLFLTAGLLFFGQRGNLVSIYINIGLCYLVRLRDRISLGRILIVIGVLMGCGLYLGSAREGIYSLGEFFASLAFLLLYGNNFTDFRDFGWVYADWNHQFWIGKTYLAGLATFVPRGASDFRTIWSFGIATGWTVGLDTETHPGLKPGLFSESFFNFGWPGMIAIALIFGIILRRVDIDVKLALGSTRPSMMKAFASTMLLSVAACLSGSLALPGFYGLCGMYLVSWLYLQVRTMISPHDLTR